MHLISEHRGDWFLSKEWICSVPPRACFSSFLLTADAHEESSENEQNRNHSDHAANRSVNVSLSSTANPKAGEKRHGDGMWHASKQTRTARLLTWTAMLVVLCVMIGRSALAIGLGFPAGTAGVERVSSRLHPQTPIGPYRLCWGLRPQTPIGPYRLCWGLRPDPLSRWEHRRSRPVSRTAKYKGSPSPRLDDYLAVKEESMWEDPPAGPWGGDGG